MIKSFYQKLKFNKIQLIWIALSLLLFAVISVYLFTNYIFFANPQKEVYASDFLSHLNFMKIINSGNLFIIPHPGFHIIVILFSWISFTSLEVSSIIVLTLCVILSFAITYFYLRSSFLRNHLESILITWILFLVSAIFLPFFSKNVYLGQGTPNIWHSPTFIIQKPLAILIFYLTILFFPSNNNPLTKNKILILAFLLLTSVWIKPNFAITFILSLFIYIFLSSKNKFDIKLYFQALIIVIPSIISLVLQYYFTYKLHGGKDSASLIIDFLAVWKHFSPNPYISFLLGIAFPLMIVFFRLNSIKKNPLFILTIVFMVIALTQMALFAEEGVRFYHWNFSWSYYIGLYFIFFITLIEYFSWINKLQKKNFIGISMFFLSSIALFLHLGSGIFYLVKILLGFPYN